MRLRVLAAAAVIASGGPAAAAELLKSGEGPCSLRLTTAIEATGVAAAPAGADAPGGEAGGWSRIGFGRLRFDALLRTGETVSWNAAWDNRLIMEGGSATAGAGFALPSAVPGPFRLRQWGGTIARSGATVDVGEVDRASVAWRIPKVEVIVGRQPVGWGRGQLFSAVDIFAPFTPLEIDREWRRGVDAVTADFKVAPGSSVGVVVTGGRSWRESAAGARVRGDLGVADAELMAAKRARDGMFGVTGSMAAGDAEVHMEAAVFHTPGDLPVRGLDGSRRLLPKAVLGGSNNFLLGSGLRAAVEYHWSGFGGASPSGIVALLRDPAFQARLVRGDTQIAGRQAVAATASYDVSAFWTLSLVILESLIDPSGVASMSAGWNASDIVTLTASLYVSHGRGMAAGLPRSQFGATPPTGLIQVRATF